MHLLRVFLLSAGLLGTVASVPVLPTIVAQDNTNLPAPLGTRIAEFTANDASTGKPWVLADVSREAKATVVFFMGTECPVNNAYAPRLSDLAARYKDKGVVFVGINSNDQDEVAAVAKHVKDFKITFPVLKDADQKLAEKFNVQRMPEAFVLDGQRFVRYRGRIDDQFTPQVKREKANTRDLLNALDAVLAGEPVKIACHPGGWLLDRSQQDSGGYTGRHRDQLQQARCPHHSEALPGLSSCW